MPGPGVAVAVPRQVHGTRVVSPAPGDEPAEADGLATGPGKPVVGVVTADCVPVLLVDTHRPAAAAVHAGWRGAAHGVLETAVGHLGETYGTRPANLQAVVGPAIGGCCYEVGPEVEVAFRARTGDLTAAAWREGPRRPHVDLRAAVRLLLLAAGVGEVTIMGPCTACARRYHSYRRDGSAVGRQLSFVGWA